MRILEPIHAANSGTILVVILITAADTMYYGHTLRLSAIFKLNPPPGWPSSTGYPFKFKPSQDIIILFIPILSYDTGIKLIIASSQNHRAYLYLNKFLLHFVVNRFLLAYLHALQAFRAYATVQTAFGLLDGCFFVKTLLNLGKGAFSLADFE
ncbi:hypothetical protein ES703_118769 [subsurface metagenome]